ncbi:MAG: hypothetical protein BRD41_05910 [Bacteroidetes bacterium QS_1_63_11]|nr:MAG: hypothetical protein BRD41_05910 [Bacteroidetes bacterium QS_1_63_11]
MLNALIAKLHARLGAPYVPGFEHVVKNGILTISRWTGEHSTEARRMGDNYRLGTIRHEPPLAPVLSLTQDLFGERHHDEEITNGGRCVG